MLVDILEYFNYSFDEDFSVFYFKKISLHLLLNKIT